MNLVGKPKLIRKINRDSILKFMRLKKITTKAELFEQTDISKQTINNIIAMLLEKKLILKAGYGNSTKEGGRRPLLLKFNPDAYYVGGILLGENKIRFGITNLDGKIILEDCIDSEMEKGSKDVIKRMMNLTDKMLNSKDLNKEKLLGIGIGLPGIINFNKGTIKTLTRFPQWKNIQLKKIFEKRFNTTIVIDNEVNVRALGEKWFDLGRDLDNFITIMTIDNGIGAGVIINREIFRGKNFLCGEVGHMFFNIRNNTSDYKNMVNFEDILGENNINKIIDANIKSNLHTNSSLYQKYMKDRKVTLKYLFESYNQKDEFAEYIIGKIIPIFAVAMANIVYNFDMDLIIIQGVYALLNDSFIEKVKELLNRYVFPDIEKEIDIKRSLLSKKMGIMGAASMVLDVVDTFTDG